MEPYVFENSIPLIVNVAFYPLAFLQFALTHNYCCYKYRR